jgi:SPP1 family predicted phage head-tail adaptor
MAWGIQVSRRSPTLNTGRLRQRIAIMQVSSAQDSMGGQNINTNVLFANVWASVEALNGTDKFAAHEFVSEVSHQIVIRFRCGVVAGMQVWFKGRQLQIQAVQNPDGRNKMLLLQCIEINDSQQQNPTD